MNLSTLQFVGVSAFHTQVSDPLIGGTYMTVSLAIIPDLAELVCLTENSAAKYPLKFRRNLASILCIER